jgi:hypothetical protein
LARAGVRAICVATGSKGVAVVGCGGALIDVHITVGASPACSTRAAHPSGATSGGLGAGAPILAGLAGLGASCDAVDFILVAVGTSPTRGAGQRGAGGVHKGRCLNPQLVGGIQVNAGDCAGAESQLGSGVRPRDFRGAHGGGVDANATDAGLELHNPRGVHPDRRGHAAGTLLEVNCGTKCVASQSIVDAQNCGCTPIELDEKRPRT